MMKPLILLVEDEPFISYDIELELTSRHLDAVSVATREAAFRAIEEHARFDAAIVDLGVAGRPCFDVALLLQTRDVPLVLASGYEKHILPEPLRQCPFLCKPIRASVIVDQVVAILSARPDTSQLDDQGYRGLDPPHQS